LAPLREGTFDTLKTGLSKLTALLPVRDDFRWQGRRERAAERLGQLYDPMAKLLAFELRLLPFVFVAYALVGVFCLVIDLALPLLFALVYHPLALAIMSVTNAAHRCRQRLAASAARGAVWASLYLAPFAVTVGALHRFAR
jgi:hypothetical protein